MNTQEFILEVSCSAPQEFILGSGCFYAKAHEFHSWVDKQIAKFYCTSHHLVFDYSPSYMQKWNKPTNLYFFCQKRNLSLLYFLDIRPLRC